MCIKAIMITMHKDKIADSDKMQNIEFYLKESFKAYAESERQLKISDELGLKAIELILSDGIEVDKLLLQIKKKVLEDGDITREE
jgi:hypothetical protein